MMPPTPIIILSLSPEELRKFFCRLSLVTVAALAGIGFACGLVDSPVGICFAGPGGMIWTCALGTWIGELPLTLPSAGLGLGAAVAESAAIMGTSVIRS